MLFKNGKPVVFAHRAGQFEAPENTLIAIETAHKNGATAVEIDLDFTKDGVPVIMHDDTVDRTTNGTGPLNTFNFEELRSLNAAQEHSFIIVQNKKIPHQYEQIPTLDEAVKLCIDKGLTIDLDVKSSPQKVSKALKDVLQKYPNAHENIFVTSFYPQYLYTLRKECPEFAFGVIWRRHYLAKTISGEPRYSPFHMFYMSFLDVVLQYLVHNWASHFLGISMAVTNKSVLSEYYLKGWRDQNLELIVWTVNNPTQKEYFLNHLGVPIITDSVLDDVQCKEQTT